MPEKQDSQRRAREHDFPAHLQIIRLQEQHHLETFAVKRRKTEQPQSPQQPGVGNFRGMCVRQQRLLLAVVHGYPAAPVNLVEKPVHHHQQHNDRQQACRRLQIERRNAVRQILHDARRDEPGDQRRHERRQTRRPEPGLRSDCRSPVMLATIAARTRMDSSPSRKTRTPMSSVAAAGLVLRGRDWDCPGP